MAWPARQGGPGLGTVVSSGGVMLCTAPRHNLRLSASVLPACRDPGERHRARLAALRRILNTATLPSVGGFRLFGRGLLSVHLICVFME